MQEHLMLLRVRLEKGRECNNRKAGTLTEAGNSVIGIKQVMHACACHIFRPDSRVGMDLDALAQRYNQEIRTPLANLVPHHQQ